MGIHLEMLFNHLKWAKLKIELSKCQVFKQHLYYLGHFISEQSIQPLLEKLITIRNLKEPSSVDDLYHFLGLTGYYRRFIPLFADI